MRDAIADTYFNMFNERIKNKNSQCPDCVRRWISRIIKDPRFKQAKDYANTQMNGSTEEKLKDNLKGNVEEVVDRYFDNSIKDDNIKEPFIDRGGQIVVDGFRYRPNKLTLKELRDYFPNIKSTSKKGFIEQLG